MAPKYLLYSGSTVDELLEKAGKPQNNDQYLAGEPPVSFFTQPPKGCAAVFSTMLGTRPFRFINNPTYEREGYYWWAAEIQKTCDGLRRHMPDVCRNIENPRDFWDLYRYFDAVDIYQRGAQNLWNVIKTLIYENDYARQVVEVEQKWQMEQHLPLFKVLAAKLLRKPDMQSALLEWDKGKQPDILKALGTRELQVCFKGYSRYPEHFLEAIRGVFRKYYDSLQKNELPLALGLDSADNPNINIKEGLNGAPDDPFMDKFDIPNKIVNGVVIADGTSQTAARKAGYNKPNIHSTNLPRQPEDAQVNGASEQRPVSGVPAEDTSPNCQSVEQVHTAANLDATKRCSSAPIGANLARTSITLATNEPRTHAGNSHVADQKHIGLEKPSYPEGTYSEDHIVANTAPITAYDPNSHLQEAPRAMHNGLPPPHHQPGIREASYYQAPSLRQPALPIPPVFVPNTVAPAQLPGYRDRGISQGAFANQIPTYALSQQYMQGPPPIMQQAQGPAPVYIHAKKDGNNMNGMPPYAQIQHYNAPPAPVRTHNFRDSVDQKKNSGTKSNGKWQQVGSDDIHGPKVIFRKDSARDQARHNSSDSQWQSKELHHLDRRTSTTSTTSGFRRLSNSRPQQYNNYASLHPAARLISTTGNTPRTPVTASQLLRDYGCVNAHTPPSVYNKFDPCPCNKCNERDRTIYVIGFKDDILKRPNAKDCLKRHFSKFGQIEDVTITELNFMAVHIRFASPQSTIAAVRSEPEPLIEGLGDSPVSVNFRTGSQFFVPRIPRHVEDFNYYGHFTQDTARVQPTVMPRPPIVAPNNFNAQAQPFQYRTQLPQKPVSTPAAVIPSDHRSGATIATECAMSVLDRAATQSGFGKKEAGKSSSSVASSLTLQPPQALTPVDLPLHAVPSQQPTRGSQLDGTPQDPVNDISNCAEEINTSSQTSIRGTPIKTPQSDNDTPLATIPLVTSQDDLAQLPGNKDLTTPDEDMRSDYGTVRVRPEKAQYVPIPPEWRQNPTPPHCLQGGQQMPTTIEDVIVGLQSEISENQSHLENGKHTREELDSNAHAKRKASPADEGEEASDQLSPKKKSVKVARPGEPIPDHRGSQTRDDEQKSSQTTASKKKKKNRNKRRQNQDSGPASSQNYSADTPYETRTFQPAIATYNLPQYPQPIAQELGSEKPKIIGTSSLVQIPLVSDDTLSNGNEPFPAYRDIMSGPQLPIRERQINTSKWSLSGNESAVVEKLQGLNPVAQDFVPHLPITGAENSSFNINFLASTMPSSIQSFHGEHIHEDPHDCAPGLVSKEYDWGRSQSGSRSYGGKSRYKNKQGYKHSQKSVNDQPPIGTPRAEFTAIVSKDTITSKEVQVPVDQQFKPLKQETSKEESKESRSVVEPRPKELLITDTPKNIKVDQRDRGKGKEKEANIPEAKVEEIITTDAKPENDKRIEAGIPQCPELQTEPSPNKATHTTSTVLASTPSATVTSTTMATTTSTANTKPKQGKSKNRTAPKKGVGTPPRAEAKGQTSQPLQAGKGPLNTTPRKPILSLNNADDFPELPSRPGPALAPIPLVALPRPNAWQRAGRSASSMTSTTTTKANDVEGKGQYEGQCERGGMVKDEDKDKEKAPPPFPKGERKGG